MTRLVLFCLFASSTILVSPMATASPEGLELVAKFECHRCHEGTGLPAAPRNKHCVRCHQDILGGRFEAPKDALRDWKKHIVSLRRVPDLERSSRMLRRAWVERYLREPHDVRPHMRATMPRLQISPQEAKALAAHLVPDTNAEDIRTGSIPRGRQIFARERCNNCHEFGGAGVPLRHDSPFLAKHEPGIEIRLAPDLRYARDRLRPNVVAAWIHKPERFDAKTKMPRFELPPSELEDLVAFVLRAPLETKPSPALPKRLPVLKRVVRYVEVEKRLFKKLCWHCHSSPDFALGDGGPGNTGGFGFSPRGIDLSSYRSVAGGYLGEDGERVSLFAPAPDGTPRLLASLLARQQEEAGQPIPGVRGMPLGLPAMSPEDIQLVETWIAQGRPR